MSSIYLAYFNKQLRVFSAVLRQLNELDFFVPPHISSPRMVLLLKTMPIASASSVRLWDETNIAEFPTVSGIAELLEAITGVPHFIASRGGKPKPSKNDG